MDQKRSESGSSTERRGEGDGEESSASENQMTEAVTIHEELMNSMYFSVSMISSKIMRILKEK